MAIQGILALSRTGVETIFLGCVQPVKKINSVSKIIRIIRLNVNINTRVSFFFVRFMNPLQLALQTCCEINPSSSQGHDMLSAMSL